MNEKCSLDNLSRYLRVIGLLSLIIILIIVVYYYLQSNHGSILEKYESYSTRPCKVYFTKTDDEAAITECDKNQTISKNTAKCSYTFDGWSEFDKYTDNDGKIITYPKKVNSLDFTNTGSFTNPMFTNSCFNPNTTEDADIPQEFEYTTNDVVKYDENGTSGNTAVGTNVFNGLTYSSIQFLYNNEPKDNLDKVISSICSINTNKIKSLDDKVFYMFVFGGTDNKLKNITSVILNNDQTTFTGTSKNVLTDLPPSLETSSFGIQYDTLTRALKIFKKNNILRNVIVYKFNYMSYVCTDSKIKNYMKVARNITPAKFIIYGSPATPNYSRTIPISKENINTENWWSNYSSTENFNRDFSVELRAGLETSIDDRKIVIYNSYSNARTTAQSDYDTADAAFNAASSSRTNFSSEFSTFSSLMGITKLGAKVFDYKSGYTSFSNDVDIRIPDGATASKVGSDVCITFTHTGVFNTYTNYNLKIPSGIIFDLFMIGGGGGGGGIGGAGGGSGACIFAINQKLSSGDYVFRVGGSGSKNGTTTGNYGYDTIIYNSSTTYYKARGGGGGAADSVNGNVGGCSGGAAGAINSRAYTSPFPANDNYFKTNQSSPATFNDGIIFGNKGGNVSATINWDTINYGGGGGIGAAAENANPSKRATQGGDGLYQVALNGKTYNLKNHFAPDPSSFGVQDGNNYYIGGGGGGGGFAGFNANGRLTAEINGGRGGGGIGKNSYYPADGTDGIPNTGSGGGGGSTGLGGASYGGNGGSGLLIIRLKSRLSNTIPKSINNSYPLTPSTNITIKPSIIQTNTLTSFIFLQSGYYYFKANLSGNNYQTNMMMYSDLMIFDEQNLNDDEYNARIVYKYNDDEEKYFNKLIYIPFSKFYKLAYRYTLYNNANTSIDANFNIDCSYQASSTSAYVQLNTKNTIQADNNSSNYSSINNINFNISLTTYLFSGIILNGDYNNATNMVALLSNVKYEANNNTNYNAIIDYLDTINFFNIGALQINRKRKLDYKNITLPAIIEADYVSDSIIINIRKIIKTIDDLKSNNNAINYRKYLTTDAPTLYKDATITDIFGNNYERLVTIDKLINISELSDNSIPDKKIYVEAVA
jgi:hypothetical protein